MILLKLVITIRLTRISALNSSISLSQFSGYFLTKGLRTWAIASPHAPHWSAPEEISDWAEATFPCSSDTFHAFCNSSSLLKHVSKSRSRPSTRQAPRQIGLSVSDWTRALRAKRYVESWKILKKLRQILKNIDINIHVSYVQNLSPSTLNIKRKHKYTHCW